MIKKRHTYIYRIVFDILAFGLSFVIPWWCMVIIWIGGTIFFGFLWEALLYSAMIDTIYAKYSPGLFSYMYTCITLASITIASFLRKYTKLYGI